MKFTFGITSLFVATFLVCCVMTLFAYEAYWLLATLCLALIMNALGALAAIIITKCFGFPSDGGYRDPEIRREQQIP